MNTVNLIGRITKAPELRATSSNKYVMQFTLAVNRPFKNNEADFIPVIVWEKQAEFLHSYANKGSLISVEGSIRTRTYEVDGTTKYVVEVVAERVELLDSKKETVDRVDVSKQNERNESSVITSDDLPF